MALARKIGCVIVGLFGFFGCGAQEKIVSESSDQTLLGDTIAISRGGRGGSADQSSVHPHPSDVINVEQGSQFGCAVKRDETVWCWGENFYGQVGNGDRNMQYSAVPVQVIEQETGRPLVGAAEVSAGTASACARKRDGTVWCWGWNDVPGLFPFTVGLERSVFAAVRILETKVGVPLDSVLQVAVGNGYACARKRDGTVWCWGTTDYGGLGVGSMWIVSPQQHLSANPNAQIHDIVSLDVHDHTCAVRDDGHVFCWGWNFDGQVMYGREERVYDPIEVMDQNGKPFENALSIAVTYFATCVKRTNGTVACWGSCGALFGQAIGVVCRKKPETLNDPNGKVMDQVSFIHGGGGHFCLARLDGSLWCFGSNLAGQLGDGTQEDKPQLVPVTFGTPIQTLAQMVAPGSQHTCLVDLDGKLACWGNNGLGALGNGHAYVNSLIPVLVKF